MIGPDLLLALILLGMGVLLGQALVDAGSSISERKRLRAQRKAIRRRKMRRRQSRSNQRASALRRVREIGRKTRRGHRAVRSALKGAVYGGHMSRTFMCTSGRSVAHTLDAFLVEREPQISARFVPMKKQHLLLITTGTVIDEAKRAGFHFAWAREPEKYGRIAIVVYWSDHPPEIGVQSLVYLTESENRALTEAHRAF